MKRFFFLLLLMALLALPLTGVLAQDDHRATDPFWNPTDELVAQWRVVDDVEAGAEITFWTMSLSPTFDEYIQKIVENFELAYPEVNVTWEDQPWDSLQDKVRNSFATGTPADVMNISPAWLGEFADAGLLLDMDAAMADYPEVREQYSDGAWTTRAFNGVSYQVPWYLGLSNFLGYNKALLEELGLTEADLPTTWPELYAFAERVREINSDYYAISLNFGPGIELNLLPYLLYNDVPAFLEDGTVGLNTGTAAENLQLWVDLVQNDLIPRQSLTDDHRQMVERFSQGETVLIMIAPHLLRLVQETNPEVFAQVAVAPGVTGSSGKNAMDVQSLVVPASAPYPKAALALSLFVTNPEVQAAFSKEVNIFPSNLLSYADPFFQAVDPADPVSIIRPLALDYVTNAENRTPTFPNDAEVQQVIVDAQNAALLGVKEPQQALDDMVAQMNTLIAEASN